jgi:hypothetical protein
MMHLLIFQDLAFRYLFVYPKEEREESKRCSKMPLNLCAHKFKDAYHFWTVDYFI